MAAAARATLIGRDDAHFRDLLARLPAHLVACLLYTSPSPRDA